jgi:hypothetical protein
MKICPSRSSAAARTLQICTSRNARLTTESRLHHRENNAVFFKRPSHGKPRTTRAVRNGQHTSPIGSTAK